MGFYDLAIRVAFVRAGPIRDTMVHLYLRRRAGEVPIEYLSDTIKVATERILGIRLFQEQVMQIAMLAADFTAGEANQLRRAMVADTRVEGTRQAAPRLWRVWDSQVLAPM